MDQLGATTPRREPWIKAKLVGQEPPFKLKERSGPSAFAFSFRTRYATSRCSTSLSTASSELAIS